MPRQTDDDPLWLHSPVKRLAFRAVCYVLFVALGYLISGWAGALGFLVLLIAAQHWLDRSLGEAWRRWVQWQASPRQGKHYEFSGVSLDVHDDGRDCWVDERSVRRLLGLQQDPAFKARFPNQWREAHELGLKGKQLWIKVSALHQHLGEAAERMDPRRLKLRSYLDREILQPAQRRHARDN